MNIRRLGNPERGIPRLGLLCLLLVLVLRVGELDL